MANKHDSSKTQSGLVFETLPSPQNDRVESTVLVDLRRRTRFNTSLPGEAFTESGAHVHVTITNLSLSGLRLEGNQQMMDALFPKSTGRAPDINMKPSLEVHFSVPTDSNHLALVKVNGRTVYTRCSEKDIYQIGMEFITIEGGRKALAQYLSSMETAR